MNDSFIRLMSLQFQTLFEYVILRIVSNCHALKFPAMSLLICFDHFRVEMEGGEEL